MDFITHVLNEARMSLPKIDKERSSGRRRSGSARTFIKSHRVFKNWTYDSNGKRSRPKKLNNKLAKFNADLCSTYYENPASGTQTVHGLSFDIDLQRTNHQWIDEKGRVSWSKIGAFLAEMEQPILSFVTKVAESTSGKGLGVYLPIAPLEIVESTAIAQKSARALQAHIIQLLNYYGIGADPGAMGLVRDMPNYFNPRKIIDSDFMGIDQFVDNRRYPVVSELLRYTNKHPAIRRLKSQDARRLFSGHRTSEKKLARLYEHLLEEALESSIWMSSSEMIWLTGLSKATFYKFISSKHEWLTVVDHGKSEGYELTFSPSKEHSERCFELLNSEEFASETSEMSHSYEYLDAPEWVQDGERNEYLTRCIIELKVKGVQYYLADQIMRRVAARIPGAKASKNCRNIASIVKSIYYHRLETFGTNSHPLNFILRDELNSLTIKECRESTKKSKKGTTVGSILALDSGKETRLCREEDPNLGALSKSWTLDIPVQRLRPDSVVKDSKGNCGKLMDFEPRIEKVHTKIEQSEGDSTKS